VSEIRRFVTLQADLKDKPAYYVLAEEDGTVVCSADAGEEDPAGKLESALKGDLAFRSGSAVYAVMAQDSAGGIIQRIRIKAHGTAPKSASQQAVGVNGDLVQLVGRMSQTSLDHFEKLYSRQDDVIEALLESNSGLAKVLASLDSARQEGPNPAVSMAESRLSRLIEVGMSAAVNRLGGGPQALPQADGSAPRVVAGRFAQLRAFVASDLSDSEIDAIIKVVLSVGAADQVMGCLTTENMSKALGFMGG
jgi:hypothetical protein